MRLVGIQSLLPALAISVALGGAVVAQEEYLGVPGPLTFDGTEFSLAWSSRPTEVYIKQEYLPAGEALESYSQMFMVEAVTEGATPEAAASAMIASLEARKATDSAVNYDMIGNEATGEVILDFLLSDSSSGTVIVEWNAYRYAPLGDGLVLYAISRRGYDDQAIPFIQGLKEWRMDAINALATMDVPPVTID